MKKTETRGRKKLAKSIQFIAGRQEMEAIDEIEAFYQLTNHQACLRQFIALTVLDIAALPKDPKWTDSQKKAWQYCQEQGKAADDTLVLLAAKCVLAEHSKNDKLSVRQLNLMTKGKLVEFAEGKGISCVGKRKSGIIKRIKGKQDANT